MQHVYCMRAWAQFFVLLKTKRIEIGCLDAISKLCAVLYLILAHAFGFEVVTCPLLVLCVLNMQHGQSAHSETITMHVYTSYMFEGLNEIETM